MQWRPANHRIRNHQMSAAVNEERQVGMNDNIQLKLYTGIDSGKKDPIGQ